MSVFQSTPVLFLAVALALPSCTRRSPEPATPPTTAAPAPFSAPKPVIFAFGSQEIEIDNRPGANDGEVIPILKLRSPGQPEKEVAFGVRAAGGGRAGLFKSADQPLNAILFLELSGSYDEKWILVTPTLEVIEAPFSRPVFAPEEFLLFARTGEDQERKIQALALPALKEIRVKGQERLKADHLYELLYETGPGAWCLIGTPVDAAEESRCGLRHGVQLRLKSGELQLMGNCDKPRRNPRLVRTLFAPDIELFCPEN